MASVSSRPRSVRPGDHYLVALCCVLFGYALLGKGFAYFGYRPIFVGELTFTAGLLYLARSGCLVALLASPPCLLLSILIGWTLSCTLPYLGTYGIDALRDSVIIVYGGFAFVVAALLIDDYRRINAIIRYYRVFIGIYVPAAPVIFPLSFYFQDLLPNIPGTTVSIIWVGAGEVAVHLAGATVFTLAGLRKPTAIWMICLLCAVIMVSAVSRAALLAYLVPVVCAAIMLGKARKLIALSAAGLALLAISLLLETSLSSQQEARVSTERRVSSAQVIENVASIVGQGGAQTEDTKEWREKWWRIIIANTVHGPYFWTGRGFGVNLGVEDGFASAHSERPLRSPHNGNMTILARAGVPGLVLWGVFLTSWFGMLLRAIALAFRRGPREWIGFLLFIACYTLSCLINASFDVALEAPMQGVWFWCLIGFGIGTTMIYRYMQGNDLWRPPTARQFVRAGTHRPSSPA